MLSVKISEAVHWNTKLQTRMSGWRIFSEYFVLQSDRTEVPSQFSTYILIVRLLSKLLCPSSQSRFVLEVLDSDSAVSAALEARFEKSAQVAFLRKCWKLNDMFHYAEKDILRQKFRKKSPEPVLHISRLSLKLNVGTEEVPKRIPSLLIRKEGYILDVSMISWETNISYRSP